MFKQILLWTFGMFILLQAIQIKIPDAPKSIDPKKEIQAGKEISTLLKTSCYDCHSYRTTIPWYGYVAPFSFEVKSHIKEGRIAVNFQEWGDYDEAKKQKVYKGIVKTINFRMPMPMYLKMHENAKLSKQERDSIKHWAQKHVIEEER